MEFAITSTLARLWSRGDTIVHPLSEGKTTGERGEEGRVGWLMRGRIEKRERAALIDPFFSSKRETVASLITEGTEREGYCVSGNQRGPGNCARDVLFFNSVSKGGWVWCAVFEEDGGKTRRCRRFGRRIEGISVGESRELCRNYCVYDIYAGRWAKWLVDFFWRDECDDNWMDFCLMKKCGIV